MKTPITTNRNLCADVRIHSNKRCLRIASKPGIGIENITIVSLEIKVIGQGLGLLRNRLGKPR